MEIRAIRSGENIVLHLNGRLDAFNYEVVKQKLDTLIKMGKQHLQLELSQVPFIAVPNLRYLVGIGKSLKQSGGSLKILEPNDFVYDRFRQIDNFKNIQVRRASEGLAS